MKPFCENQQCHNPGARDVPVSVDRPSDQKRTLCASCEEAYSWGVQHGAMLAEATPPLPRLGRFLVEDGFAILAFNRQDPSRHGPFEAWAYQGPLDTKTATPVTFGVGASVLDSLDALELQLEGPGAQSEPSKTTSPTVDGPIHPRVNRRRDGGDS